MVGGDSFCLQPPAPPANSRQLLRAARLAPPSTPSPGFMIGPAVSKRVRASACCTATSDERTVTRHLTFAAPPPPILKVKEQETRTEAGFMVLLSHSEKGNVNECCGPRWCGRGGTRRPANVDKRGSTV